MIMEDFQFEDYGQLKKKIKEALQNPDADGARAAELKKLLARLFSHHEKMAAAVEKRLKDMQDAYTEDAKKIRECAVFSMEESPSLEKARAVFENCKDEKAPPDIGIQSAVQYALYLQNKVRMLENRNRALKKKLQSANLLVLAKAVFKKLRSVFRKKKYYV